MNNQRLQVIGFFTLLVLAGLLVLFMFFPYLQLLALAGILAVLFQPVHQRLARRLNSEGWAALVTVIIILLIVIVPLWLIGTLLWKELLHVYTQYRNSGIVFDVNDLASHVPERFRGVVGNLNQDLGSKISGLTDNAFHMATSLITNVAGFIFSAFIVFFSVFYLLKDRSHLKDFFNRTFPLSREHESVMIQKLEEAINGVVKGSFLVALVQGGVATIGFIIFGVPQPILWGAFTVLAALVPNIGTSISIIPAVLYLFFTGHVGAAVGMAIWGAAAVGTIDNIISPRLIGSKTRLHPLLVLLSVIGGIQLFGYLGFLLGPIITAGFMALLEIYQLGMKE